MAFLSRRTKVAFALFFIMGVGVVATWFVSYSNGSLEGFSDARMQGALIAQQIVDLSNQSANDLEKINGLDREGNFEGALSVTADVVKRSEEVRELAVKLSAELEKMTKALSNVHSFEARQAALESISNRLALITRLISYSNSTALLLEELRSRFSGSVAQSGNIAILVEQINSEVNAINNFNRQAGEAMERFDQAIAR